MINQVINSILEAEKKADEILKEAYSESKAIIADAEKTAKKIKLDQIDAVKADRKSKLELAEKKADEQYSKSIESATKEGDLLKIGGEKNFDKAVTLIVRRAIS